MKDITYINLFSIMEPTLKGIKNIPKPTNFGKNLKFLRVVNKLSQSALAEKVQMKRNNIASYESGFVEPKATNFLKICRVFSIDPKDMLTDDLTDHAMNVDLGTGSEDLKEYLSDQLDQFVNQTNEMGKLVEGYRTFYQMKRDAGLEYDSELTVVLDDVLTLLSSLITNNWKLIQHIYKSEEE